jgi:hypothetical protein
MATSNNNSTNPNENKPVTPTPGNQGGTQRQHEQAGEQSNKNDSSSSNKSDNR